MFEFLGEWTPMWWRLWMNFFSLAVLGMALAVAWEMIRGRWRD